MCVTVEGAVYNLLRSGDGQVCELAAQFLNGGIAIPLYAGLGALSLCGDIGPDLCQLLFAEAVGDFTGLDDHRLALGACLGELCLDGL